VKTELRQGDIFGPLPFFNLSGTPEHPAAELSKNRQKSELYAAELQKLPER